jgi:hypothetical protein
MNPLTDWRSPTINALIGYIISWLYFFIALPIFQTLFGRARGTAVNYGISWIVWIVATHTLTIIYSKGDELDTV